MRPDTLLLSHRGAHTVSIAENSITSFDCALEQGCDGFECDVRLTACGRAVLCHNSKVEGVTVSAPTVLNLFICHALKKSSAAMAGGDFLDMELKVRGLESRFWPLCGHSLLSATIWSPLSCRRFAELKARSGTVPAGIICGKASQLMAWRNLPVEYVIVHKALVTRRLVELIQSAGRK